MNYLSIDSTYQQDNDKPLQPHNAELITPRGKRIAVNISPEAAAVWTRYGFRVEFFGTIKAVA